ncbi:MAG: MATE family efflux transporter [Rubrivivax sp.]|nr:MATE family efflux transporter [Rubrivivax sp.]
MPPQLLAGPILATLLRLAAPNVLALFLTAAVAVAETYYIGRLGTPPLAAMALVFPFAMLTQMLSAGAMGGGVSSAVSRALGAGDRPRAQALAVHALVIGAGLGAVYTALFVACGPVLYRALGGAGEVLAEASRYGAVLFAGAWLVWLANTLASIIRGTGNMRVPSAGIAAMALVQIALGGALGLGAGPLPRLGMVGVALGHVVATALGVALFFGYLRRARGPLRLGLAGFVPRREMFDDILRVGAIACLSPLQAVLTALIFTALVARVGVGALAGYGIGQRLEFLLIPIAFGVGVAAVPMVGMAIGAGQVQRARRVAWTAGAVSAFNLACVGALVALWPDLWARLFSADAAVLQHAREYLRVAGPAYPFFGFGLTLYFASQGAGRVLGPVLAATARLLLVAAVGAWLVAEGAEGAGAGSVFALAAAAMVVYGLLTAAAVKLTRWGHV